MCCYLFISAIVCVVGGKGCTSYDVVINPAFFESINSRELLMGFFLTVVLEGLEAKYNMSLDRRKNTLYWIIQNAHFIVTVKKILSCFMFKVFVCYRNCIALVFQLLQHFIVLLWNSSDNCVYAVLRMEGYEKSQICRHFIGAEYQSTKQAVDNGSWWVSWYKDAGVYLIAYVLLLFRITSTVFPASFANIDYCIFTSVFAAVQRNW